MWHLVVGVAGLALFAVGLASGAGATGDEESSFFSTVRIEERPSFQTNSDGDLWPSAWTKDDALIAAWGDGAGFPAGGAHLDIGVARITGGLGRLSGENLAVTDAVGSIWTSGGFYNRKPTGMVAVGDALYLAVQDLAKDFNDAPAASISKSTDGGRTWTWDKSAPMFRDHVFTTIFFADFGKNRENAPDEYVYAYGLDGNWRMSYSDRVPDPTRLHLARVRPDDIMDRAKWRFFAGFDAEGRPAWTEDINARKPVLETERRIYRKAHDPKMAQNISVLSQGSVVYNKPLNRYLYTSWTEFTFEFYEAPRPWGPWKRFLSKDFGAYPWTANKNGGYATTIPSKFISADGRTMYVQANTFFGGAHVYNFALRRLTVTPYTPSVAENGKDAAANLARVGEGATPISKSLHFGNARYFNDGVRVQSDDDWDREDKPLSWWGYTWDREYRINEVVFTSGGIFDDGGWFRETPRVQVRKGFRWADVPDAMVSPAYPGTRAAGAHRTFTFRFAEVSGDGIRIIGAPGGSATFTSLSELEAYYR